MPEEIIARGDLVSVTSLAREGVVLGVTLPGWFAVGTGGGSDEASFEIASCDVRDLVLLERAHYAPLGFSMVPISDRLRKVPFQNMIEMEADAQYGLRDRKGFDAFLRGAKFLAEAFGLVASVIQRGSDEDALIPERAIRAVVPEPVCGLCGARMQPVDEETARCPNRDDCEGDVTDDSGIVLAAKLYAALDVAPSKS